MRLLYLSINFDHKNSNVHTDLIKCLANHGHDITVVSCDDKINKNEKVVLYQNVSNIKVKTGDQFEKNMIKKGLNMINLERRMIKAIKEFLKDDHFDLVLYSTPPITFANVVQWCKQHYRCKTYLALKDIFPQNAVDLEMFKKKSIIYKYFRNKEKKLYKYSDKIGCMSQGNVNYLLKENPEINKNKVELFPNSHIVREYQTTEVKGEKTVFIFGGNLGKPQGLKRLGEIIKKLENYDLAKFIIIGKGSEDQFIKNLNSKNLEYHEFLPKDEYDQYVVGADVGLISLDTRFTIPNIPSKILNYMELSKPVLAITDDATDLKNIIEECDCGWWIGGNNNEDVINKIKDICQSKNTFCKKGKNGRAFFEQEYNVEKNVAILENFIKMEV